MPANCGTLRSSPCRCRLKGGRSPTMFLVHLKRRRGVPSRLLARTTCCVARWAAPRAHATPGALALPVSTSLVDKSWLFGASSYLGTRSKMQDTEEKEERKKKAKN